MRCSECGETIGDKDHGAVELGALEDGVQVVFIDADAGIENVVADLQSALRPMLADEGRDRIAIRYRGETENLAVI